MAKIKYLNKKNAMSFLMELTSLLERRNKTKKILLGKLKTNRMSTKMCKDNL